MEADKVKDDYHPYDATSRSQPLPSLPPTINLSSPNISREEVSIKGARCFLLHNFLSEAECDFLVNSCEKIGFDAHSDVKAEYPPDYRSNQRLIVISQPFADALWSRVQPQLHYKDVAHLTPLGWATEGIWLPTHVNEGFLFSRYKQGNFFNPHYDGMYKNQFDECSIYTLTVYLNDDFQGGNVVFLQDKDRNKENVLYTFTPKKGTALIFNHDTLHAGEPVTDGVKYIVRTGIMFRHVEDLSDPNKGWKTDPEWIHMRDVFQTFAELGKEGNPEKFTKTFLELQRIQLAHGRSLRPAEPLPLPNDVMFHALSYLKEHDVIKCSLINREFHSLSRCGIVWRQLYERKWGNGCTKYLIGDNIDSGIVNFYSFYQKRYIAERTKTPICFYISDKVEMCKATRETGELVFYPTFAAQAYPSYNPWDSSFEVYEIGYGTTWFAYGEVLIDIFSECVSQTIDNIKEEVGAHPVIFVSEPSSYSHDTSSYDNGDYDDYSGGYNGSDDNYSDEDKEDDKPEDEEYEEGETSDATKAEEAPLPEGGRGRGAEVEDKPEPEKKLLDVNPAFRGKRIGVAMNEVVQTLVRRIHLEAVTFVEAGLCSLYTHSLSSGIAILFEETTQKERQDYYAVDVSAWRDNTLLASKSVELYNRNAKKTIEDQVPLFCTEIVKCVEELQSKASMPRTVTIITKEYVNANVLTALTANLEALQFKPLHCNARDVLRGAYVYASLPGFNSSLYYKSKLFEQMQEKPLQFKK